MELVNHHLGVTMLPEQRDCYQGLAEFRLESWLEPARITAVLNSLHCSNFWSANFGPQILNMIPIFIDTTAFPSLLSASIFCFLVFSAS